jgi:hypothetical protein
MCQFSGEKKSGEDIASLRRFHTKLRRNVFEWTAARNRCLELAGFEDRDTIERR